jgi:hypothetical protein
LRADAIAVLLLAGERPHVGRVNARRVRGLWGEDHVTQAYEEQLMPQAQRLLAQVRSILDQYGDELHRDHPALSAVLDDCVAALREIGIDPLAPHDDSRTAGEQDA